MIAAPREGLPRQPANGVDTARRHVVADAPVVSVGATVEDARGLISSRPFEILELILAVDEAGRYVGAVPVGDLLRSAPSTLLAGLIRSDWPVVASSMDQEQAVDTAVAARVGTLPVIDAAGRPIGCLPAIALLDILAAEHREDVHRMAGIVSESSMRRQALEDPPLARLARRLPWLVVGLALSTAGTAVMAGYEETLKRNIAVAFFVPALVYLTDAIGTQTEAIAVRGLTVTTRSFARLLVSELATGTLIGCALGTVALLGIWATFGDVRLAIGVSLSLVVAGTVASAIGLSLPWALLRFGIDPALGSGPVATIIQDVMTLLLYFSILGALL